MSIHDLTPLLTLITSLFLAWGVFALTIGKYRQKVDSLEENVKFLLKLDLSEFKEQTKKCKENIPLNLTELDKKLVTDSGFLHIFETMKDDLCEKLFALSPTTKYDVQEKARSLMDGLTQDEAFKPLHDYAFKEGHDIGQILRTGSLCLRDYYFEKHPEIKN